MIELEKPNSKITDYVESNFYGKFEIEPLERGFGTTLGNALRRVMLSSLPGSALSSVKIDGVLHEFQTIEGVVEDVTTIILNLKQVVIKNHSNEGKVVRIDATKEGPVLAGDIEHDADIEIVNPEDMLEVKKTKKFLTSRKLELSQLIHCSHQSKEFHTMLSQLVLGKMKLMIS